MLDVSVWGSLVIQPTPPQKQQTAETQDVYGKAEGFMQWLHVSFSILVHSLQDKGAIIALLGA